MINLIFLTFLVNVNLPSQVTVQGFSSSELLGWLDQLAAVMPLATSSAAYWICKAKVAAKAADGDFSAALRVLDDAEEHQPQVELLLLLTVMVSGLSCM